MFSFAEVKKVLAILMIMVLMFQVFSKLNTIAFFYLNQNYIAKVLCIEKDVPDNDCQGHCQLKKQLEEEEEDTPATFHKAEQTLLFIDGDEAFIKSAFYKVKYTTIKSGNSIGYTTKQYHPPQG